MVGMPGAGNFSPPYVPGPSAGPTACMAAGGAMSPMTAALLGTGAQALMPLAVDLGYLGFDALTGAGKDAGTDLAEREKLFAGLQGQLDEANMEAIRRARASAGQAIGGQLAASGVGGLSSFNPILAAQARQGEAQMANYISSLEQKRIQDRADYETGRAAAIDQRLDSLTGSAIRRRNAREAYRKALG